MRAEFRRLAARAGIPRCFAPHQLQHDHAVELAREGGPLKIIQRQLGHSTMDALGPHGGAKIPSSTGHLNAVQERVYRGRTGLRPVREAIAARAAVVGT